MTGYEELEEIAATLGGLDLDAYDERDLGELLEDVDAATAAALRQIAAEQGREYARVRAYLRRRGLTAQSTMRAVREFLAPRGRAAVGQALTRKSSTAASRAAAERHAAYGRCVAAYGIHSCEAYRP